MSAASQPLDRAGLLSVPPPHKAWLTLCNDPDNTTIQDWQELHDLIWQELELPLADSVFLRTRNEALRDQVSVESHPEIATAHPIDTLHTWGDFTNTTGPAYCRQQALECVEILRGSGLEPRVWVDHSYSTGNLLHRSSLGAVPEIVDASGHRYENQLYSLDLIVDSGIRYVWDGELTRSFLDPDRPASRLEHYRHTRGARKGLVWSIADQVGAPLWRRVEARAFDYAADSLVLPRRHCFSDGRDLYCFRRFGSWERADIHGFGEVIAPETIENLVSAGGFAIVYTHLGKRRAQDMDAQNHVPETTRRSLQNLAERHRQGELALSSTSHLLDYLVLRRHAVRTGERLDFRPDGIRYPQLVAGDLAGHRFGVSAAPSQLTVTCSGAPVEHEVERLEEGVALVSFPETSA